jgi:hypothetical protein
MRAVKHDAQGFAAELVVLYIKERQISQKLHSLLA